MPAWLSPMRRTWGPVPSTRVQAVGRLVEAVRRAAGSRRSMASKSRSVGTGVKPVVVSVLVGVAAAGVARSLMAGMMRRAEMMLMARPAAMTGRRWRSRSPEIRTGCSRSWKLREARAVAIRDGEGDGGGGGELEGAVHDPEHGPVPQVGPVGDLPQVHDRLQRQDGPGGPAAGGLQGEDHHGGDRGGQAPLDRVPGRPTTRPPPPGRPDPRHGQGLVGAARSRPARVMIPGVKAKKAPARSW